MNNLYRTVVFAFSIAIVHFSHGGDVYSGNNKAINIATNEATNEATNNANDTEHEDAGDYYSFGVFPYLSTRDTAITYGPVSADFSQALGHEIRLRTSSSFVKFTEKLANEYYDIALIQPFDYLPAIEEYGYEPLARVDVPLVTVFVVKDNSPFNSLSDLRGKRIAFPPEPAANSRLGLRELIKAGLVPGKDIYIDYLPSHSACMHQVVIGDDSACVTGPPIVKIFNERMNAQVHVLAQTEPIPHILFVAHDRVPPEQRLKLQQLITSWHTTPHGKKLLQHLGFPKFTAVKPNDYEIMRQFAQKRSDLLQHETDTATLSRDGLVLGVFPYLPPKRLAQTFAPLPPALSAVINRPVRFRTASSFAKFAENLENRAYDIALVQPFDYELAINSGYVPLVQKQGLMQAGFFVLEHSHIKTIQDLKGTTIAMPPHGAAVSRLALAELRKQGLIPGKNLEIQYRRAHDSCLFQLRHQLVSACAAWSEVAKLVSNEEMQGITLIHTTDSIPNPLFVVKKSLPVPLQQKLMQEMISWKNTEAGRELLRTLRIGPFERFDKASYDAFAEKRQEYQ